MPSRSAGAVLMLEALVWLAVIAGVIVLFAKGGRPGRRSGIGTAAVGTMYDFLNEDKRRAIEIIVEEKAEARDPEDKDGNLPELAQPGRTSKDTKIS